MLSPSLSVSAAVDDSDLVSATTSADTRTLTVYFQLIPDVIVAEWSIDTNGEVRPAERERPPQFRAVRHKSMVNDEPNDAFRVNKFMKTTA